MRAKDFIVERTGKLHSHHASVQRNATKDRDPGGYYPNYHQLRTGLALAMADGGDKKLDIDHESWMGPYWTQHPYTKVEYDMFKQSRKAIPTEHHEVIPWSDSEEPEDTQKLSPVAKHKKNRYGI